MYGFEYVLDGIRYSIFIFSTFTGHFHPFTPQDPIDVDETFSMDRKTFYLAWYTGEKNTDKKAAPLKEAKLIFLEKYWLTFIRQSPLQSPRQEQGRYFHTAKEANGSIVIGQEIKPVEAIQSSLLYTYKVNEKNEVIESNLVRKTLLDKYSYTYKPSGSMDKVDIYRSSPPSE